MSRIGIRREDKNEWERRVPLVPADIAMLVADAGISFDVQPSPRRVFRDEEFTAAGVTVDEDLSRCGVVLAVKEIPAELLREGVAYTFFSHTIKGQAHNMPLLRHVLDVGCTLIDYERIVDDDNARLIHFGRFAGLAGMVDALWAFGRRWAARGVETPFLTLQQAYAYPGLGAALTAVRAVGEEVAASGLDGRVGPLVVGLTGYGHVSAGAQEVLDQLPLQRISPADVPAVAAGTSSTTVYAAVFTEADTVRRRDGEAFTVAGYRADPAAFDSVFAPQARDLSIFVNAVYWDRRAPRLLTVADLRAALDGGTRLAVVADLSCDIEGGIEFTVKATSPDDPVFVYDPATRRARDGVEGDGMAVLAVDNLPCELPREASEGFSAALRPFVPALATATFGKPFDDLALPPELHRAVVAHRGQLAPAYDYLDGALAAAGV